MSTLGVVVSTHNNKQPTSHVSNGVKEYLCRYTAVIM